MTRNTHKQRVLTAFMASYSLLLLIPVIMGIVVFVMASCILRSDTLKTSSRVLDNAVQTIESACDTASDLTLGISTSRDFCRRLDEVQPGDKYAIAELAGMASALHTSNNLISRYFLYYHGSDDAQFVLEESRAYADLDVYYKSCFQYGALDSEQFFTALRLARQTVFLPTARTHDLYGNVSEAVLLVIPFRKSSSTFRGHMVFYFDKKLMEKNFAPLMESGANYICLRAADGTTLMELGEPALRTDEIPANAASLGHTSVRTAQGVQHLLCCRAEGSGITVLATIPDRAQHLAAAAGGRGHRAVSAGCRGADLRRLALQPQAALPDRRSAADGGRQRARRALAGQAGGGKAAARPGKAERPARRARHAAARRDGLPAHQGQLPQRAGAGAPAHAHRHLPGGQCLARRIHDAAPTGAVWRGEHGAAQLPLHDGDGHTLCVCPGAAIFDAQDEQRVHPALHAEGRQADGSAVDRGRGRAARSLRRGGGVLCGHRLREPQHAQPVLHLGARADAGRRGGRARGLRRPAQPLNKAVYDYTAQDENALIACVQSGDAEGVRRVLGAVRERNFEQRSLSAYMCQSLYMAMLHTLSRFDCPLILPSRLMNVPLRMEPEQFFAELADIYGSLIEQMQSGRRRASMVMMENVLQYIAQNYQDPNLSLTMLAQHFGLTEPYLSKRFKQHVGVNFSAYLEQQRISRAHELLRTTGMSVQAISDSVGYANIRSFRRAYIRVVGCPPSADRGGEETEENAQDGEEA